MDNLVMKYVIHPDFKMKFNFLKAVLPILF